MSNLYAHKDKLITKYGLFLKSDRYWYVNKENSYEQKMFKDSFFQKSDLIIILFRIYKLCFGKVSYFRRNIDKYQACKYHYVDGFIDTELWDAEFFRHKKSGYILDFRFLQSITDINIFRSLVAKLELMEDEPDRDKIILSRLGSINSI